MVMTPLKKGRNDKNCLKSKWLVGLSCSKILSAIYLSWRPASGQKLGNFLGYVIRTMFLKPACRLGPIILSGKTFSRMSYKTHY